MFQRSRHHQARGILQTGALPLPLPPGINPGACSRLQHWAGEAVLSRLAASNPENVEEEQW